MQRRFLIDGMAAIGAMDGGRVDNAVKHHISRAIMDCEDRPGEEKPRKVTVEVYVAPVTRQDGATCDTTVYAKVKSSVPDHVSAETTCRILNGGDAWFNDLSEDNPDQMTLDQGLPAD